MPDLHITSTLLSGPAGATAPATGANDAGAFSSLLAGTIACAPPSGPVEARPGKAALPAVDPADTGRQSSSDPALDAAFDPTTEPGRDAAHPHADPANVDAELRSAPDAAAQLMMELGILPPPTATREGANALPHQGVTTLPDSRTTTAAATGFAPASGSALASATTTGVGKAGNFDPTEPRKAARDLPRLEASVPVSFAADGMRKGAQTGTASEVATTNVAPGTQTPFPAAVPVLQPTDAGTAPAGTAAPVQLIVPHTVGSPAWREAFSSSVSLMASQRVSSAELNLHPAELGPVQVSIRIEGGEASITCVAQHADTRTALDAALPRLREMLEANGIALGEASVGPQSSDSSRADHHQAQGTRTSASLEVAADAMPPEDAVRVTRTDRLVDIFA